MSAVAVLGAGAMGGRMAAALSAAGHEVRLWNRTPETARRLAGAHGLVAAPTPRDAAAGADVVLAMVTDVAASERVWLDPASGAAAGLAPGAVAVESSTVTPAWVHELARRVREARRGEGGFCEAPVIGSRPQADAGALVTLVGGDETDAARLAPVLAATSSAVHHVGPLGTAAALKLVVNGLLATQVALLAEVLDLLGRAGVEPARAAGLLGGLPVTSPAAARVLGLMAAGEHAPNFPIRLVAKDLAYLTAAGDAVGAALPVTAAVRERFAAAVSTGRGELDVSGVGPA